MNLAEGPKLIPAEASAAILVTADQRFLMQRRDDKPDIFFPGWLGLFGGALEDGEDPETGLRRELAEELAYAPATVTHFCTLGLDFGFAGYGTIPRHFFAITLADADIPNLQLGEGRAMEFIRAQDLWSGGKVIPYDATVLWQYLTRHRF